MQVLNRILDLSEKALDAIMVLMMIVMGSSIFIQVFSRYVLNRPTGWSEEVARYLFIWIAMVGSAVVIRKRRHVDVTVLVDRLPRRVRMITDLVCDLAVLSFLCVLLWVGIGLTGIANRQLSPALEVPMSFAYVAMPVGAFFMIVFLAATIVREWTEGTRIGGGERL